MGNGQSAPWIDVDEYNSTLKSEITQLAGLSASGSILALIAQNWAGVRVDVNELLTKLAVAFLSKRRAVLGAWNLDGPLEPSVRAQWCEFALSAEAFGIVEKRLKLATFWKRQVASLLATLAKVLGVGAPKSAVPGSAQLSELINAWLDPLRDAYPALAVGAEMFRRAVRVLQMSMKLYHPIIARAMVQKIQDPAIVDLLRANVRSYLTPPQFARKMALERLIRVDSTENAEFERLIGAEIFDDATTREGEKRIREILQASDFPGCKHGAARAKKTVQDYRKAAQCLERSERPPTVAAFCNNLRFQRNCDMTFEEELVYRLAHSALEPITLPRFISAAWFRAVYKDAATELLPIVGARIRDAGGTDNLRELRVDVAGILYPELSRVFTVHFARADLARSVVASIGAEIGELEYFRAQVVRRMVSVSVGTLRSWQAELPRTSGEFTDAASRAAKSLGGGARLAYALSTLDPSLWHLRSAEQAILATATASVPREVDRALVARLAPVVARCAVRLYVPTAGGWARFACGEELDVCVDKVAALALCLFRVAQTLEGSSETKELYDTHIAALASAVVTGIRRNSELLELANYQELAGRKAAGVDVLRCAEEATLTARSIVEMVASETAAAYPALGKSMEALRAVVPSEQLVAAVVGRVTRSFRDSLTAEERADAGTVRRRWQTFAASFFTRKLVEGLVYLIAGSGATVLQLARKLGAVPEALKTYVHGTFALAGVYREMSAHVGFLGITNALRRVQMESAPDFGRAGRRAKRTALHSPSDDPDSRWAVRARKKKAQRSLQEKGESQGR